MSHEPPPAPGAEQGVETLARLARQALSGDAPRRDASSFARANAKVLERQVRGRRRARALAAAGVLAAAAVVALLVNHSRTLTYRVVNGAMVDGARIVGGAGTEVRFSDGSELTLGAGAETHIAALDAHGGKVSLDEGSAKVKIAKVPGAAWTLGAGPYSVRVTGTAFSLNWSKKEQAFEIAMQHGSVVVTGPLISSGIALHAGQRLRSAVRGGRLVVEDVTAPPVPSAASDPSSPVPSAVPPTALPAESAPPAASAVAPSVPPTEQTAFDWRNKAARGAFNEVIEAAERRGLDGTLATASLEDLAALADSARYARRPSLARRALLAERARFPKSKTAHDAAFFLGRLAEEEGGGAAEWYDRYLAESLEGAYASQALGRKMMLVYQQRGSGAARDLAADYLARFPRGSYAATARKLGAEPRDKPE